MKGASSRIQGLGGFVWSIAEILRGDFKQSEYGKVILPFVVMRRLDCILEASKDAVLAAVETLPDGVDDATRDMILFGAIGGNVKVYNLSRFTFDRLRGQDARQLHDNLVDYITKFSGNVRDIFLDKFLFTDQLKRLKDGGILWNVFERFCEIDLHPDSISNLEMGYLFEELIRRFSEISNETAGEHFTPREVIRLIVDLLIANDDTKLTGRGIIRQVYDPACGTGGMLALTEGALKDFNSSIRVELFGQELNGESFGICKSDMLVTGHDPEQIAFGNTLSHDAHKDKKFHYMLSNPPYGVDWKKYQDKIKAEADTMGFDGRFGAGTPRISDGQLLFLQHMISHFPYCSSLPDTAQQLGKNTRAEVRHSEFVDRHPEHRSAVFFRDFSGPHVHLHRRNDQPRHGQCGIPRLAQLYEFVPGCSVPDMDVTLLLFGHRRFPGNFPTIGPVIVTHEKPHLIRQGQQLLDAVIQLPCVTSGKVGPGRSGVRHEERVPDKRCIADDMCHACGRVTRRMNG